MNKFFIKSGSVSFIWVASFVLNPAMAFAIGELPTSPKPDVVEPFVSDGSAVSLDALGLVVRPPVGWFVDMRKDNGMAVIMSEPKVKLKKVTKEITTYQRNITVTVKHEATPIDETSAAALAASLKKEFSKSAAVSDYDIMETKIIDFSPTSKGLLVYTSFRLGDINMMQLHVLVSGGEKQFLQTYTDMASRFVPTDAGFASAWTAMTGLQVKGSAPIRFEKAIKFGAAGGFLFFSMMTASLIRRRRRKKLFMVSVMALEAGEGSERDLSNSGSTGWPTSANGTGASARELPVTAVNLGVDRWQVSRAISQIKVPKINVRDEDSRVEVGLSEVGASNRSNWILPVQTRASASRISL